MSPHPTNPDNTRATQQLKRLQRCPLLVIAIATICLTQTILIHNSFEHSAGQALHDAAQSHAKHHHNQIKDELNRYAQALPLMRGYAQATQSVTRTGWRQFIQSANLETNHPAVYGFGYIEKVRPNELPEYINARKAEGLDDFHIHQHKDTDPINPDAPLYILAYEEPESRNRIALGLNVAANPENYDVYLRSIQSAQTQLSAPFVLKQNESNTNNLGMVMALPVFDQSKPTKTIQQRTAAVTGWVVIVLDFNHFVSTAWDPSRTSAQLTINTTDFNGNTIELYNTLDQHHQSNTDTSNYRNFTSQLAIGGQTYSHTISVDPLHSSKFSNLADYQHHKYQAKFSTVLGLLITSLITALAWFVTTSRARAVKLAKKMTASLHASEETQRTLAHQAQQANSAKTEFLTNMSHELRTPMTAILGYTDILAEMIPLHENPESMRSNIRRIKESGHSLLAMINDILDLSIIEEGNLQIVDAPCFIPEILAEVLGNMKPHADHRGVALNANFDSPIPTNILADAFRIRQVLSNLIFNAIKFTQHGAVTIIVKAHDNTISFAVKDTGIGIEESKLQKLFDRFEQADSALTRKYGGIGLGLTISRNLAQLMNGSLTATSTLGQGSTFTLTIPLAIPQGASQHTITQHNSFDDYIPKDQQTSRNPSQSQGRRHLDHSPIAGRILLAEDGQDNQKLIKHFLTKAGLSVEIAENGQLALDLYKDNPNFDLIIMDMQMPVLDGYAATKELRKNGCTLPILALTAHAMQGDRKRCLACGCDDYQTKPIDRTKLLHTIKQLLSPGQTTSQSAA